MSLRVPDPVTFDFRVGISVQVRGSNVQGSLEELQGRRREAMAGGGGREAMDSSRSAHDKAVLINPNTD